MIKALIKRLRTTRRIRNKTSNKEYWANLNNYKSSWRGRTELIANLIPENSSVLEFGCGEMYLKDLLPPGCNYVGSDIVARDQDTLVIDLNKEMKHINFVFDVVVFSGVLEYIFDFKKIISNLDSPKVFQIITSYADVEMCPNNRRANGWVNDYTRKEFIKILQDAGFYVSYFVAWNGQIIYVFE